MRNLKFAFVFALGISSFMAGRVIGGELDGLPKLNSAQTRDGKGVPSGRSDSREDYLHMRLGKATDANYGRTEHTPVKIGPRHGGLPHILYLNSLRGPNAEPIEWERIGTCCEFELKSAPLGGGMLDIYRLRIDGPFRDIYLFVDMYDSAQLEVPAGLTQRN